MLIRSRYRGPALFALGFRVFFLLGALWAIFGVGIWAIVYTRGGSIPGGLPAMTWHGREMLFGYTGAILAGFLLTAPGNWTGAPMPAGLRLAAFAALWLAGRLLPYAHGAVPSALVIAIDTAFFPALAVYLFLLLRRFHLWRNMVFPAVLVLMSGANALSHLPRYHPAGATLGTEAMLYLVLVVISIVAGRVIPGFTVARFPDGRCRSRPAVNALGMALLLAAALAELTAVPPEIRAGLFAAAATAHAIRLGGWYTREVLREPMLGILYLAYAWLVWGLALKAAAYLGYASPMLARHSFTVGVIGTLTLGMMCRVTLGHTGRALAPPRGTLTAFALIAAAAFLRVILPLASPSFYSSAVLLSSACWVGAFGIYLICYGPMLCRPRVDGQPG